LLRGERQYLNQKRRTPILDGRAASAALFHDRTEPDNKELMD
jgi:hypothetical protein